MTEPARDLPLPLSAMQVDGLVGVLTDIDDTLTTDGRLLPDVYAALWRLQAAGLMLVPVTGRSSGWAHMVMKTWPVKAVIAESGGVYMIRNGQGQLRTVLHDDAKRIQISRDAIAQLGDRIVNDTPGLAPASDNRYRLVDYALDYCEEVSPVDPLTVAQTLARFHSAGFSARASSVHINAWDGQFDKGPMTQRLLREHFSGNSADPSRWVFIGDAPNDQSMFECIPNCVGVANLKPHLATLAIAPRYITRHSFGAGFVELADFLLTQQGVIGRD
jgi:HAD superfamily hydrolase (TIGR01484 family)